MTLVIVESSYDSPLTDERRQLEQDRLEPCLKLRNAEWVQSFEALDRRRRLCFFRAPDVDAMRESLHSAGIAFDRVWAACHRDPDPLAPDGPARERY